MRQNSPECGRESHISERTNPGCDRKTFWTKSMCHRACNTCVGLQCAIRQVRTGEWGDNFELALNRIGSHSVECHFGMTRSTLRGDPRWLRFFSAQISAVIIQRIMRDLEFHPYIRRFVMTVGCVLHLDTAESVTVDLGDIIARVQQLSLMVSRGWEAAIVFDRDPFITPFRLLSEALRWRCPEAIRLFKLTVAGGGIQHRWFTLAPGTKEMPDQLAAIQDRADE